MGAEAAGGPPATGRRGQLPPLYPSLLTRPTGRFQAESRRGRSPAPRGRRQAVSAGARLPPPPHPVSKVGSIHRSSSCCGFCAGPTRAGRLGGSLRGSGTAPPCPAVIWKDGAARHVCTCDLVTHQQAKAHWGGTTHESVCPLRQPTCCAARTQQRKGARVSTCPTAFPERRLPGSQPRDLTTATSRLFPFSALFYNLTRAYQTRNSSNLNMAFGPRIIRDFYLIFCFEIHHPARFAST